METNSLYEKVYSVVPAPKDFERLVESSLIDTFRDDDVFVRVLRLFYCEEAKELLKHCKVEYLKVTDGTHSVRLVCRPYLVGPPLSGVKWNSLPRDPVDWVIEVSADGRLISIATNPDSKSNARQTLRFNRWDYDNPATDQLFVQTIPEGRKLVDFIDFQPTPYLAIGSTLNNFEFQTIEGTYTDFEVVRQPGKIAVIYLWKRIVSGDENLQTLATIKKRFATEVDVIVIEVDSGSAQSISDYLGENNIDLQVYRDIEQNLVSVQFRTFSCHFDC
ncbi:MAG: hypothetical protein AAF939_06085 [Planctomycetota bacterium]